MGKRKRSADQNKTPPPPSDLNQHSSPSDSLLEQKSSQADDSEIKPSSSTMESIEVSKADQSPVQQHNNCSRAILLSHPRRYYSRHYSRRSSYKNAEASTSHGKGTYLRDENLSFKLSSKYYFDSARYTERRDRAFFKPEKIRQSFMATDASSSDAMKMVCGICGKLLKKKPYILDNSTTSGDLSVVAVLVCGHIYHADCLEQRTCHDDRRDPPCPSCAGLLSEADASMIPE